ncbi:prelamin-A/C-like isoform X2 [Erpetoichthys calabaricus]|uniref:prelamin-A/C-like isoform X2 n=1 Tax=Erpetoichthys calabaricus TaxID=27687 RepID=UPI00109F333A|nr:prelamin-A/C-like isoform X2 [Erpetoichthys calabaricus]
MPHPASAVENVANGTREVFYKANHPQLSQHLNDCIRIVKSLRNQQTQFDSTAPLSEWLEEKIIAIQHLYESEIQALHEKLRQLSHEKARMELNNFHACQTALNYENRISTMNSELFRRDEELRNLRLLLKENVNKGRSSSSVSMSSVYDLGSSDREELSQRFEEAKDRYENEYFHRLQLQDEVQMLKQKLELQEGFYSQESQKMRERISGSELYILQLEEQLAELKRKQTGLEEKVGETNAADETQPMWFNKEAEKDFSENLLDSSMQQISDQVYQEKTGKDNLQQQLQELTGEFTALETMLLHEESNNRSLIERLQQERMKDQQQIQILEARLEGMQNQLLNKMKKTDHMESKGGQMQRRTDYFQDIRNEEDNSDRTGISVAPVKPVRPSTSSGIQRTRRQKDIDDFEGLEPHHRSFSVPPSLGQKTDDTEQEMASLFIEPKEKSRSSAASEKKSRPSTAQDYNNTTSCATGNIKIVEVSTKGIFIKLVNTSEQEEDIGGYVLQQNVRGHPVAIFKFPPRLRMNATSTVTVWSAASRVSHNPPVDFLWKEQNLFGTGTECTTILCKPNGQAVAWYTPVHWNPRLQEAWQSDEFNSVIHDKERSAASDHDDELIVQKVNEMAVADFEPLHNVQSKSLPNSKEEEQTFLLKREKEAPLVLFPTRSPWAQSSSTPTHPAYTLPRTLAKGNDGSSLCRQARSQSARPDPTVGELYASSMSSKSADPRRAHNVGAHRRGPTRSAGHGSGGVLYVGTPSPMASPLQKFNSSASQNMMQPSQMYFCSESLVSF